MEKKETKKQTEQKNKTIKKFEEITEKNKKINNQINELKENIEKKSKNIKKELTKDIKEISEDVKEKSQELTEDIKDKSQELKKDLSKKSKEFQKEFKEKTEEIKDKAEEILNNIKDNSKKFDKKDIEDNKAMACLAYIMAPVPYFVETKSKWVRYHSIQGMNLFIIEVLLCLAVAIINSLILWPFWILKTLLKLALYSFIVLYAIIGIINVCNEEAKELPLINKFKFIKK